MLYLQKDKDGNSSYEGYSNIRHCHEYIDLRFYHFCIFIFSKKGSKRKLVRSSSTEGGHSYKLQSVLFLEKPTDNFS